MNHWGAHSRLNQLRYFLGLPFPLLKLTNYKIKLKIKTKNEGFRRYHRVSNSSTKYLAPLPLKISKLFLSSWCSNLLYFLFVPFFSF